jgi:hypothetical protein
VKRRRHPVRDEFFELLEDGTVRVTNEDMSTVGIFTADGRWQSGTMKYADPHMLQWIGGLQSSGTISASAQELSGDSSA